MPPKIDAALMARWITRDAEIVSQIVEQILREEAWWIAVRSKKFALNSTVWVDRSLAELRGSGASRMRPAVMIPAHEADR